MKTTQYRKMLGIVLVLLLAVSIVHAQEQPTPTPVPLNAQEAAANAQSEVCQQNELVGYTPVVLGVQNRPEGPSTVMLENTGWAVRILQVNVVKETMTDANNNPMEMLSSAVDIRAESALPENGEAVTLLNDVGFNTAQSITVANCDGKYFYSFPTMVPFPPPDSANS